MSKRKFDQAFTTADSEIAQFKNIYSIDHQHIHAEDDQAVQYIFRLNPDNTTTLIRTTALTPRLSLAMELLNWGVSSSELVDEIYVSRYDFNRAYYMERYGVSFDHFGG